MKDAEIIRQFDQNIELIIEGLAARSGREFKEVLLLLQEGRKPHGTHNIRRLENTAALDDAGGHCADLSGGPLVHGAR